MKKLTYTTAIVMALTATSVFAHHPAVDMVEPEIYEMIDENVADTPHVDMIVDDMGSAMGDAMQQGTAVQTGAIAQVSVDVDDAMDSSSTVDTIDLMENVDNALAQ